MDKANWAIDAVSLTITSVIMGLLLGVFTDKSKVNYFDVLLEVSVLTTTFLLALTIFTKIRNTVGRFRTILTVFVGLSLWLVVHVALGIVADWRYVSSHPYESVDRHLTMAALGAVIAVIFGTLALMIIVVSRSAVNLLFRSRSGLD